MKFKVPVNWFAASTIAVEAETLDEACNKVHNGEIDFPKTNIQNIHGTMEVDFDFDEVEELNPGYDLEEK